MPLIAGLAIVLVSAAACGGHPDSVAREFYKRMAAPDVAGMEQLVCEEERTAFRQNVRLLDSISPASALTLHDFKTRTEESDGTSATMTVIGGFLDGDRRALRLSSQMRVVREGGDWCLSGERDGFEPVRENAEDIYFFLFSNDVSFGTLAGGYGSADWIGAESADNTLPRGGPPPVLGPTTTTISGLKYQEVAPGNGRQPEPGQTVLVHYASWLNGRGRILDNSLRGEPSEFVLGDGRVVAGFDEGSRQCARAAAGG
jgi:FKBP-type peptidyl-prolyl cis-trans isomerase